MQPIPITNVPSQTLNATLGGQDCTINLRTLTTGLFLDLIVAGVPLVNSVICQDRNLLVREPYIGFVGDLCFIDTQGTEDPQYAGLGERWQLVYLSPSDL